MLGASLAALAGAAALPSGALASHSQIVMIQDTNDILVNPTATMQQFRQLGVTTVRVVLPWAEVAPSPTATKKPARFNPTDPNAYPLANWAPYDMIVGAAAQYGLSVDLTVSGGAPRWAEKSHYQGNPNESALFLAWEPNSAAYGQFVQAAAKRYDGHFTPAGQSTPLPAVHFWSLFNEPNFGQDLGPEASNDSSQATAAMYYRSLINAGWKALRATGHGRDTILIGELAAQGQEPGPFPRRTGGLPGLYGQTRPLTFIRELYCVDSRYRTLRGGAAAADGCPQTTSGSRRFRSQNPALFGATGFADHPYPQAESPTSQAGNKVDYAKFQDLGNLQSTLDRVNRAYGSRKRFPIYNTEYGYITNPPHAGYVSPATAATYINEAEYLSWTRSYVASYMQYLLTDPPPNTGPYAGFASGLESSNGQPKGDYDAFRLPVWMPHTSFSKNANEEIWGDGRAATFMVADGQGPQTVSIQLNGKTIDTVTVKSAKAPYFDLHIKFPSSGTVRLAYTYPKSDPFLPVANLGTTVYSRSFRIKVH